MFERSVDDEFVLRHYSNLDCDWVIITHLEHYRSVEQFDSSFDAAVSDALTDIHSRLGNDRTTGFILQHVDGTRVGSVFACDIGAAARLRLFRLDRALHGRGLGRSILAAVMDTAVEAGFHRIEVSTFDDHVAACKLYEHAGFAEKARAPRTAFGRHMVQVDFVWDACLSTT